MNPNEIIMSLRDDNSELIGYIKCINVLEVVYKRIAIKKTIKKAFNIWLEKNKKIGSADNYEVSDFVDFFMNSNREVVKIEEVMIFEIN